MPFLHSLRKCTDLSTNPGVTFLQIVDILSLQSNRLPPPSLTSSSSSLNPSRPPSSQSLPGSAIPLRARINRSGEWEEDGEEARCLNIWTESSSRKLWRTILHVGCVNTAHQSSQRPETEGCEAICDWSSALGAVHPIAARRASHPFQYLPEMHVLPSRCHENRSRLLLCASAP